MEQLAYLTTTQDKVVYCIDLTLDSIGYGVYVTLQNFHVTVELTMLVLYYHSFRM